MYKFFNVRNPEEVVEVNEERANILRSKIQDSWQELIKEPESDVPTTRKQNTSKASGKRSGVSKPKRVQQVNRGTDKSDKA